jgi:hypothetical protein
MLVICLSGSLRAEENAPIPNLGVIDVNSVQFENRELKAQWGHKLLVRVPIDCQVTECDRVDFSLYYFGVVDGKGHFLSACIYAGFAPQGDDAQDNKRVPGTLNGQQIEWHVKQKASSPEHNYWFAQAWLASTYSMDTTTAESTGDAGVEVTISADSEATLTLGIANVNALAWSR